MPRATFAGVTFDLLLQGLEDRHEGLTTVREIPGTGAGPPAAYVDLGGPMLHRRTVTLKVDTEADYLALAVLPGTPASSGTLESAEGAGPAVLLSVSRSWRKGTGPQLLRTEWLLLPPPEAAARSPAGGAPATPPPTTGPVVEPPS
jgi:hypothetical protein